MEIRLEWSRGSRSRVIKLHCLTGEKKSVVVRTMEGSRTNFLKGKILLYNQEPIGSSSIPCVDLVSQLLYVTLEFNVTSSLFTDTLE